MTNPKKKIVVASLDHEVGQAGASDAVGGIFCAIAIVVMFIASPR